LGDSSNKFNNIYTSILQNPTAFTELTLSANGTAVRVTNANLIVNTNDILVDEIRNSGVTIDSLLIKDRHFTIPSAYAYRSSSSNYFSINKYSYFI